MVARIVDPSGDVRCEHGFIIAWGGEWGVYGPECNCDHLDEGYDDDCPWREAACNQGCKDWRDD